MRYQIEFTLGAGQNRVDLEDSARQELNTFLALEVARDPIAASTVYMDSPTVRISRTERVTFLFTVIEIPRTLLRMVTVMNVWANSVNEEDDRG